MAEIPGNMVELEELLGMPYNSELKLKVQESSSTSYSEVYLSQKMMAEHVIWYGDSKVLLGKDGVKAACTLLTDSSPDTLADDKIKMNSVIRDKLGVSVGDSVTVLKNENILSCKKVCLRPFQEICKDLENVDLYQAYLRPYFRGVFRLVNKEDILSITTWGGREMQFKVTQIEPSPFCIVGPGTIIECNKEVQETKAMKLTEFPNAPKIVVGPVMALSSVAQEPGLMRSSPIPADYSSSKSPPKLGSVETGKSNRIETDDQLGFNNNNIKDHPVEISMKCNDKFGVDTDGLNGTQKISKDTTKSDKLNSRKNTATSSERPIKCLKSGFSNVVETENSRSHLKDTKKRQLVTQDLPPTSGEDIQVRTAKINKVDKRQLKVAKKKKNDNFINTIELNSRDQDMMTDSPPLGSSAPQAAIESDGFDPESEANANEVLHTPIEESQSKMVSIPTQKSSTKAAAAARIITNFLVKKRSITKPKSVPLTEAVDGCSRSDQDVAEEYASNQIPAMPLPIRTLQSPKPYVVPALVRKLRSRKIVTTAENKSKSCQTKSRRAKSSLNNDVRNEFTTTTGSSRIEARDLISKGTTKIQSAKRDIQEGMSTELPGCSPPCLTGAGLGDIREKNNLDQGNINPADVDMQQNNVEAPSNEAPPSTHDLQVTKKRKENKMSILEKEKEANDIIWIYKQIRSNNKTLANKNSARLHDWLINYEKWNINRSCGIEQNNLRDALLDSSMLPLLQDVLMHKCNHEGTIKLSDVMLSRPKFTLGCEDLSTVSRQYQLALTLYTSSQFEKSASWFKIIIYERSVLLGPGHWLTLKSRYWLAWCMFEQGMVEEALKIFEGVLKQQKRVLQADHEDINKTELGIAQCFYRIRKKPRLSTV